MSKLKEVIVAALAMVFLTGWGDYERVECLKDDEQLPVYQARVELEHNKGWATVVIIAPGYALTAAHAVREPVLSISVLTSEGPRAALVASRDETNDIALLSLNTQGLGFLPVSPDNPKVGSTVWTVGFPEGDGISFKGPVLEDEKGLLVVGAPVFPGMSGGPIVACEGGEPIMVGSIQSFNYRIYRHWETPFGGNHEEVINTGTSNATAGAIISVFTQYAIEHYESREKEQ